MTGRRRLLGALAALLAVLAAAAAPKGKPAAPAPVPKGDRVLGIAVNEDKGCPFETNLAVARTAGLQAVNLAVNWRETETVDAYAKYYGLGDKAFREYLRTMGLRAYGNPGKDKEAFRVLKAEAKSRGW